MFWDTVHDTACSMHVFVADFVYVEVHVVVVSDIVHRSYELKEGVTVLKVTHYLLKMTRNSHECTWNLCVGVCSVLT